MNTKPSRRPQPAPDLAGVPVFLSVGGITAGFRIVQGELIVDGVRKPYAVGRKRRVLVSETATDVELGAMFLEAFRAAKDHLQFLINIRGDSLRRSGWSDRIAVDGRARFVCKTCGFNKGCVFGVEQHVEQAHGEGRVAP